jgi:hypothetical protein
MECGGIVWGISNEGCGTGIDRVSAIDASEMYRVVVPSLFKGLGLFIFRILCFVLLFW